MLESIIERMEQDFFNLKDEIFNNRIDVRKIESLKYKVNNEVHEFSPKELKEMTNRVMSDYLYGDKAKEFERKERIWPPRK